MERDQRAIETAAQIIEGVDEALRKLRQGADSPTRRELAALEMQGVIAAALKASPIAETPQRAGRRKHHFDK